MYGACLKAKKAVWFDINMSYMEKRHIAPIFSLKMYTKVPYNMAEINFNTPPPWRSKKTLTHGKFGLPIASPMSQFQNI